MPHPASSRRDFLKTTGSAAAALPFAGTMAPFAHGAGADKLKIGLVGCGGRGSGALLNALNADPGTVLWALGDAFADQVDSLANRLADEDAGVPSSRIELPAQRRFSGLDCYKKVVDAENALQNLAKSTHKATLDAINAEPVLKKHEAALKALCEGFQKDGVF